MAGVWINSALGHLNKKSYLRKKGLHLFRSAVLSDVILITEEALYLNGMLLHNSLTEVERKGQGAAFCKWGMERGYLALYGSTRALEGKP